MNLTVFMQQKEPRDKQKKMKDMNPDKKLNDSSK